MSYAKRGLRRATSPLRELPTVLIPGVMRGGTTALYSWLCQHPDIRAPSRKEAHYFDFHFERGPNWYRAFFPVAWNHITLDASPSYMNHPLVAERAISLMPNARVVILLRDPAERAWSQYRLRRRLGTETRDFRTVIEAEMQADPPAMAAYGQPADIPYLTAGLYAEQLRPWLDHFGHESVLVLDSDRLFYEPKASLVSIQRFIGVDPVVSAFKRVNAAPPGSPPDDLMKRMVEFYSKPNRDLENLLGRRFSWM